MVVPSGGNANTGSNFSPSKEETIVTTAVVHPKGSTLSMKTLCLISPKWKGFPFVRLPYQRSQEQK